MTTYKFVSNFDEQAKAKAQEVITRYLQIASFPNPKTNLYQIRRFHINQNNEFVNVKDYFISKSKYNKLLQKRKSNEYKLYSVYNLNEVKYPCISDLLLLKSDILGTDYNYYGSAPF